MPAQASTTTLVAVNGTLLHAHAVYTVDATAYTAGYESTGKRPGDPGYGITKSGTVAVEGRTVAVDPELISLGTWIYIEGMGVFRAEDTGSKIKGRRIDIFMEDLEEALQFGRRKLTIYVLQPI